MTPQAHADQILKTLRAIEKETASRGYPPTQNEIADALRTYAVAERRVHELVGYEEQWRIYPLEAQTGVAWMLFDHKVAWAVPEHPLDASTISEGKHHGSGAICASRDAEKHVLRTETHAMVIVDTQCDGNVVMMVFENAREVTDPELKKLYEECW